MFSLLGEDKKENSKDSSGAVSSKSVLSETNKANLNWVQVFLIALIGAIIGGLIMALIIPYTFGINPQELFKGKFAQKEAVKEIVNGKRSEITVSPGSVVDISKKVQPSVVNIRVQKVVSGFFGNITQKGVGSGVIFTTNGYIITNNHVVQGADEIWVTVGTEDLKGKVIGTDPDTDLAVVKIEKDNLPAAELGTAKNLQVGELVVAIGSPFGFEHSVSAGILSALNRTISATDQFGINRTYTDLIQTDTAINPGNSGGALANSYGQVVGINSFIIAETQGQGIGFAISIDLAKNVAEQLIEKGKVSHPYIGINGRTLDEDIADSLNLPVNKGAIIIEIAKGSPAWNAGMRRGDIIVEFNGKNIESMENLIAEIRNKNVGDLVEIVYVRDGNRFEVELTLEEKPQVIE
ncbi:trypsin-like peptidase domain-containing protein [Candidatus Oleimmundimicrobium sp.]|uniref:S1C family serine protease n=1 Tax=Candidatus Oleimmundimicrobium sp. TaxID=3060597 RepID=UPI00271629BF|nr:trypsin-like peptidase domain-containing protein [Candidatus Oleimmundimicrobium sp.]MDO8886419.1 trypsin-like peptidase domain-containing protein [Candidatus Oleimmundimicrobium sp.]